VLLSGYCRLDFEGARLQPGGWSRFKPYTSLRSNPDYARIVIVTRYDIETPEAPSNIVEVSYPSVGVYEETQGYLPLSGVDKVTFHLREQAGDLIILDLDPETPHVSVRAALAWMKQRLADPATSELEQVHLKDAVARLTALLPPPAPAK
jgi:hypothetical protein